MSNKKPKTLNSLMKYLRDEKEIKISGVNDKLNLRNSGYYHTYKGYRYFRRPSNKLNYNSFAELMAVYTFDNELKSILYPHIMFIETAIKNRVLEEIVSETGSDDFSVIYHTILDDYKRFTVGNERKFNNNNERNRAEASFKQSLKKRLDLRDRIFKIQTSAYNNGNKIAGHYLTKDASIPIWGIFELLTLGEFGTFTSCLNKKCRKSLSLSLKFNQSDDTDSQLLIRIIYVIKDLRNAIAHNDVVFDTRFRSAKINKQISNTIKNESGIDLIDFNTITDYIILVVYLLKHLGAPKREIKKFVSDYSNTVEKLRKSIPIQLFSKIILTNNREKVDAMNRYIVRSI